MDENNIENKNIENKNVIDEDNSKIEKNNIDDNSIESNNNNNDSNSNDNNEEDEINNNIINSSNSIEDISNYLLKIDESSGRPPRKYSEQDSSNPEWFEHKKHFFILSSSGKPIYSRYGDEVALNTFMASLSAMSSFVESQNDTLRHLVAGKYQFVFLCKYPLNLVCISSTGEPNQVIRQQLEYIHSLIISVLTQSNMKAVFEAKYDLRDLLGGTDKYLDHLIHQLNKDFSILLNSIQCLRLNNNVRNQITNILSQYKCDSLLFSLLISDNKLISQVKHKKTTSLKSQDIHLLMNYVSSTASFKESESWIPICLPNYNDTYFLHLYICFLYPGVCLLLFSNQPESFYQLSDCKNQIIKGLEQENIAEELKKAVNNHDYTTSITEIPNLLHFLYKNKTNNYSTFPTFSPPYSIHKKEKKRLFRLYQHITTHVNSNIIANKPHKYYYHTSQTETIMVATSNNHELYATFSPLETKKSIFESFSNLLLWIKNQENSLFIQ
ncbi:hypothetical protein DICPUDRAFT_55620 [Dictyostelium purpureum]|uniref:Vacuolar fusion protein MON1 homolog n=1 Tax=Dictyostelium purpureum TaxID=5786 RepID=F0ZMY6_DICPU|nr:uncharacterized protein DICPUDRAFT_55620 [Dictyostelium purpureum]EGC34692.1 hypothetical protein DICPUDRAFT_55620 [Dictyostelium purpureum]|eukprot:XP_003288777.1 hypothetical protein DICPUDRAFT_55620 [Dictyostelium purpureum]